jgi:hypothetical protein
MVSPPYKGGFSAGGDAAAPDGEGVGFASGGVFAGALSALPGFNGYVSRREPNGWVTFSINPPAAFSPSSLALLPDEAPQDYSSDLAMSVDRVLFAPNTGQFQLPTTEDFYLHETSGTFVSALPQPIKQLSGEPLLAFGLDDASADLSHLFFTTQVALLPSDTMNIAAGKVREYEIAGAGGFSPILRLVGVNNSAGVIDPYCEVEPGSSGGGKFHAVSQDGSEVFFTTNVNPTEETKCDSTTTPGERPNNPAELYVRINGSETLEISKPLSIPCPEVPCAGAKERATAVFQGASLNGSKVFFTTTQSLVNSDEEGVGAGNDLYEAEIEEGEHSTVKRLVQISHDPESPTAAADVKGVTRISEDGSHVYFVAAGILTTSQNGLGQTAVAKADNLYSYDTVTGETKFVAELCSGKEESGSVTNVTQCPSSRSDEGLLWERGAERFHAQSTKDGQFLVFETSAQLIRTGPEADTDTAIDVYRYDSLTGDIVRVSVGEDGRDDNGNGDGFNATITAPDFAEGIVRDQYELESRAVSEDGSTIVFATAEPLSAAAINGQSDIYVWHEGHVGLISDGRSPQPDAKAVITPSGRDIFFLTSEGLVSQDTDGLYDVYDARIGGGFPVPSVPAGGCSGDTCQGPPNVPSLLSAPASATFSGVGSPVVPASKPTVNKKKHKPKKKSTKKKMHKRKRAKRSSVSTKGER